MEKEHLSVPASDCCSAVKVSLSHEPCGRDVTQLRHDQRKDLKYNSDGKVMTSVVCFVDNLLFVWGQFWAK